jgi:hypothetical protein
MHGKPGIEEMARLANEAKREKIHVILEAIRREPLTEARVMELIGQNCSSVAKALGMTFKQMGDGERVVSACYTIAEEIQCSFQDVVKKLKNGEPVDSPVERREAPIVVSHGGPKSTIH